MIAFKRIAFYLFIISILILSIPSEQYEEDVHTRQFCAYGRLYVEFEKGNKIWGTTYLDQLGHIIPCSESGRNLTMSIAKL
jgi:hypothetical protein